jgi:hypothetical protein
MVAAMGSAGWSDAGTRLPDWLRDAGFVDVDEGERPFWWQGGELAAESAYASDVIESALEAMKEASGADEEELRAGLADLRDLPTHDDAGLGWVVHKSTATR